MPSEINVTLRIKPWWLSLFSIAVALRLTWIVVWMARHPAVEVRA